MRNVKEEDTNVHMERWKIDKKLQLTEREKNRTYLKSKWAPITITYLGEKVQIDIKYVPQ